MKLKRIVSVLLTGILLVAGMPGTSSLASVNTSGLVHPARKQAKTGSSGSKDVVWPSGPKPGSLSSDSAIVMEVSTGLILYKKNIHKQHYPASITKIMTSMLVLENSSLSDIVTFSSDAVYGIEPGSSTVYSDVGEKMSMEQCLYAIMLESANEVCLAVGEHIAGDSDSFVDMMNDKVKEIGLKNTNFNNPNGLPDTKHYTTAYDMAVIAREAIKNSTFRKITGTKSYICAKTNTHKKPRPWLNHHQMVNGYNYPQYEYKYCIGGKTGYTHVSQNTLVTYAEKNGMQLLAVIMRANGPKQGTPNEYTDTTSLLNFGFENYRKYNINEQKVDINSSLFNNYNNFFNTEASPICFSSESSVVLPKGAKISNAKQKITYNKDVHIKDGENVIGKVEYTYDKKVVGTTNILYNKTAQNHLDEASRKIVNSEIEDIESNSAKDANKHKRIAKIKNGLVKIFSPVISFIKSHVVVSVISLVAALVLLLALFLAKRFHNSDGRIHRSSGGYRSKAGRRRHARMQRQQRHSQQKKKSRRRNHSKNYHKSAVSRKSTLSKPKRNTNYSKRRKNTRESFGKNFFDF